MSDVWPPPSPDTDTLTATVRTPASPTPPSKKRLWLAAIGTGLMVGLFALLLWSLAADNTPLLTADAPAETEPSGSTNRTESGTESAPGTEPDAGSGAAEDPAPSEFDDRIAELSEFVAQERELEFKEPVEVVVLADEPFVERYNALGAENAEEYAEDFENFSGIFQALGLLPSGVTYLEASEAFGAGGVLGYYNPETGELVVRGGEVNVLLETIIVHELTHALDDQWFDLDRPEYDDRTDEVGFGFRAVVEGNARRVENAFKDTLSLAEQADLSQQELELSTSLSLDFSKLSLEFLRLQIAPYNLGEVLIDELLDEGDEQAVNEALEDPPVTSEQVSDPGKYLDLDPLEEVAAPPADGEVIEEGVFGQVILQIMLEESIGDRTSRLLEGWEGDWFVAWNDGDSTCLRVDILLEDTGDVDELVDALQRIADDRLGDASASRTDDDLARLTACS